MLPSAEPTLSASALARKSGVPSTTLRHWHRLGLVRPAFTALAGARRYGPDALHRLRFIRAAQRLGFSLEDIARLTVFRHGNGRECREVQRLIERRLEEVESRLDDLRHVRAALRGTLRRCRDSERRDRCHLIQGLKSPCCEEPLQKRLEPRTRVRS